MSKAEKKIRQPYTSLISLPNPDYSSENLRAIRKALGMTQEELAKRARVTQATVSFFESGNEEKVGQNARAAISNVLVQAEFDWLKNLGAAPKTEVEKLKERIAWLERQLRISHDYQEKVESDKEKLEETNKELLGMLGWRIKKTVEDSEQVEAEQKLMEKHGAEKLPSVEEEALRAEIAQRGKKTNDK
jgi:transcriptional regulator with XRE-family HTH domain